MVRNNLPVLVVICNNGSMTGADEVFNPQKHLGFECRYDKIMEAAGGYGEMVDRPENIRPALERAAASGKPAVVNVVVDQYAKGQDTHRPGRNPTIRGCAMSTGLRIAIIGQQPFGESVLNALAERGETLVGAFCPPDREGRPADPLKQAADNHGIPVFQFRRMRNQEAIDAFAALNVDLCVMAFVTDIVPDEISSTPPKAPSNTTHPFSPNTGAPAL